MVKSTRKSTSERRVDEHGAATTRPLSHEEISVRAYEIYLARGAVPGNDLDNWLEAERQLFGDRRRPEAYASPSVVSSTVKHAEVVRRK
jgi:hypothetical protein